MNGLLGISALLLCVGIVVLVPGLGAVAVLLTMALALLALLLIYRSAIDRRFLQQLFISALLIRMALGTVIFLLQMQAFFGGDATTYDELGSELLSVWRGQLHYHVISDTMAMRNFNGMPYMIATTSALVGP